MLMWKTQYGKNHGSPQTSNYHYIKITTMEHRGNDLLLPRLTNRRLQQRQRPLALSLSIYTQLHSNLAPTRMKTTTAKSLP